MAYGIPSGGTGGFRGWNAGGRGGRANPLDRPGGRGLNGFTLNPRGAGPQRGYNPMLPPDSGGTLQGGHPDPMQPPDQIPHGRPPIKGPPGSVGGGKPGQPPSPLDAQYFLNVAANQFKVNGELNALNQQSGYARTDLQNALSNLSRQQPLDNLHDAQSANARGGLFSTALGQQLGQLNQNYLDRQSAANQGFERGEAGRQSSEQSILGGVPIYDAGQYLAAVQRASLLAQKNPATGQKTGPLVKGGRGRGNVFNPRGGRGSGGRGFTFNPRGNMNNPGLGHGGDTIGKVG